MSNLPKATAAVHLLNAAGHIFAERPFEGVSTRQIADEAGVNLSAISYHFGSKEGLYRAVFEKIVLELAPLRMALKQFVAQMDLIATEDRAKQRLIIQSIIHLFVGAIAAQENPRWRMRLIFEEVQQGGPCYDLVINEHVNVVHGSMAQLVAKITGQPADSLKVMFLTHTILGMCLQYGLNEKMIAEHAGWKGYGPKEVAFLKKTTTEQALSLLKLSVPEEA
jgi:TetR/AcrR family transcriptional regulator, regulator of cefoperazone and chloramphenicol sensitivity